MPLLGELFTNRDNGIQKTELVIFLRPVVVTDTRLAAVMAPLRDRLPDAGFFSTAPSPGAPNFPTEARAGANPERRQP
mgnify:FL=1